MNLYLLSLRKKQIIDFPDDIKNLTVEISPKEQSSDMSCNVALLLSKYNNKTPIDLADKLKEHFKKDFKEFLEIINNTDIILDSIGWSGNVSSHEAISLDKPIITMPTKLMRGRHTYSILKILELDELIAFSKKEYVNIALKLAKNIDYRKLVIKKIKKNKNKLFNDRKSIKFLNLFFEKITY